MRKYIHSFSDLILPVIDFFYPPFKKFFDLITFRYAVCGSTNLLLGLMLYTVCYHYLFTKIDLKFGHIEFKPHSASLLVMGIFNFCFGFILMKFVVFVESNIKGRIQMVRYFMVFVFNLMLNYILLKISVEIFRLNAVLAQVLITIVVIFISYLIQRNFSFKISSLPDDAENSKE